ncbi:MAG: hemolysin [Deltaproteobacteria bacterium RIFOXYA12_FULL_58_15]|nr:MAG: hemolysin [Deltaproteobacteria bacterium RIFOXYA12_FULL_58_15]
MTLLIVYVLLALGVSFACSLMEAVLLSITPAYIAVWEEKAPAIGLQLRQLRTDVDRPLAAILSLNTMAHTFGAAGAGAQATHVYGDAYVGLFSAVLTLLILLLSEIIPKSLGVRYWRELGPVVARVLRPVIVLLWPLVALARLLGALFSGGKAEPVFHRDELAALAEIGLREGTMGKSEIRILKSLLRFRTLHVSDIMTPRTVMYALPQRLTIEEMLGEEDSTRFSRIPVYEENIDDIKGYVLKDEVLLQASEDRLSLRLSEIKRNLIIVPNLMSVPHLFDALLDAREHLALVVDEWGGTDGIVSMEDVIETLLGLEIVDEADEVRDMQELAREQWRKRAKTLDIDVAKLK